MHTHKSASLLITLIVCSTAFFSVYCQPSDVNNPFLNPTTEKRAYLFPSLTDPIQYTSFGYKVTANFSLSWSVSPPANASLPVSVENNQNVLITLVGNYGEHSSDRWAYMGIACGKSMLHAHFILATYYQGRCWIAEYYPQHIYSYPILMNPAKYLINPVSCMWGNGKWTVEFSRPMIVSKDEFKRHSWSIDTSLDNILAAYQFDSISYNDYHGKNQRTKLKINWGTGLVNLPKTPDITERLIHGYGMMVVWLLLFPSGVFYVRYFKSQKSVLVHVTIQSTAINDSHLVNAHHVYGLVLVLLVTMQVAFGILNRLGVRFESISRLLPVVRKFHHAICPFAQLAAVIQIMLGLNIVFPFLDLGGTGNNYREGGVALWAIFIALVVVWILLFSATEVYYTLRNRRNLPLFNTYNSIPPVNIDFRRRKKTNAEGNVQLNALNRVSTTTSGREQEFTATALQLLAISSAEQKITEDLQTFTWKSFDEAIISGRMLVVANGKYVYDISQWIHSHPGGQVILDAVSGTDITSDYFHEAGFDAGAHLPKANVEPALNTRRKPVPVPSPRLSNPTASLQQPDSILNPAQHYLKTCDSRFERYFTDPDWEKILSSRRPHTHTRIAIDKLSSLLVGEIVADPTDLLLNSNLPQPDEEPLTDNTKIVFSKYEYRRYALTESEIVCGSKNNIKAVRMRFCLLYPYTYMNSNQSDEIHQLLRRPFSPGECIEIQVKTMQSSKKVIHSRYYTPISGSLIAFEIFVKVVDGGSVSQYLSKQKAGGRQFKIRGPFGNRKLTELEPDSLSASHLTPIIPELIASREQMIFFTAGSGITPFLQMVKWLLLPEFQSLEVIQKYEASESDELTLLPKSFVAVKQHYFDGWAYGLYLFEQKEGMFPLAVTSLPYPRVYSSGIENVLKCYNTVDSVDNIMGRKILEGALLAYRNAIKIRHFVDTVESSMSQGVGDIMSQKITAEHVKKIVKSSYSDRKSSNSSRKRPVFVVCGPKGYSDMILDALQAEDVLADDILVMSDSKPLE
ncbi:hypothetical protein HK098_000349 [Nowakowskiella sp. JEL0407]|nr:hypothetical protein HK098_000349 [Nowakowskiella sp. JEL0407]